MVSIINRLDTDSAHSEMWGHTQVITQAHMWYDICTKRCGMQHIDGYWEQRIKRKDRLGMFLRVYDTTTTTGRRTRRLYPCLGVWNK